MQNEFAVKLKLITKPEKGETVRKGLIDVFRAMADGLEDGRTCGGTENGGHWDININGTKLD